MNGSEEIAGGFVIARGDSTIVLELEEEVFDKMPIFVAFGVIGTGCKTCCFRRNDSFNAFGLEDIENALLCVISFVGKEVVGINAWQEGVGSMQVMGLTRCEKEACGVAKRITSGMYLGAQTALTTP